MTLPPEPLPSLAALRALLVEKTGRDVLKPAAAAPPDGPLRALHATADGQEPVGLFFDGWELFSVDDAASQKRMMDELAQKDAWPTSWWDPDWYPFAGDGAGQLLVVDARDGRVVEFVHDDEPRDVVADSLDAFFARFKDGLGSGAFVVDDDYGICTPDDLALMKAPPLRSPEAQRAKNNLVAVAITVGIVVAVVAVLALTRSR